MMKAIFQAAESDSFWGATCEALHTKALRAGYIIPAKEWRNLLSLAKATFFVAKSSHIIKRTDNEIVNIAIMLYKNEPIKQVFHD
jgi:hypothetical protein